MVVAEGVFLILTSYNVLNNNLPPSLLNQEYMALETIELAHLFSKWKKKIKGCPDSGRVNTLMEISWPRTSTTPPAFAGKRLQVRKSWWLGYRMPSSESWPLRKLKNVLFHLSHFWFLEPDQQTTNKKAIKTRTWINIVSAPPCFDELLVLIIWDTSKLFERKQDIWSGGLWFAKLFWINCVWRGGWSIH